VAKIEWDKVGERFFETGVDQGVLYPNDAPGVPWNGIISIEESVSGGEAEALYFDGIKYLDTVSAEDFQATLTAFTYPDEFAECEGTLELAEGMFLPYQRHQTFGLSWRTKVGNDLDGVDHGYKIHIVYQATAAPSARAYQTLSDSPSPLNFQWTINALPTIPGMDRAAGPGGSYSSDGVWHWNPEQTLDNPDNWVWQDWSSMPGWPTGPAGNTPVTGWTPTAYIMIDTTDPDLDPDDLKNLEDRLHGTPTTPPYLPSQFDVLDILNGKNPTRAYPFKWTPPKPPPPPPPTPVAVSKVLRISPINVRSDPRRFSTSIVGGAQALADSLDSTYVDLTMNHKNTSPLDEDFVYRNDYVLGDLPAAALPADAIVTGISFNLRMKQLSNNDSSGPRIDVKAYGSYPNKEVSPTVDYKVIDTTTTVYSHSLEEVSPYSGVNAYSDWQTTPAEIRNWLIAGTGQLWIGLFTPIISFQDQGNGAIYNSVVKVYEAWIEVAYTTMEVP
jgi:hypothetical protein